ncbi:MAG: GHKL domain-containing protein [Clostridia bacterium]|nr:GHKL domain-containing protein [Clostridia bacterium]
MNQELYTILPYAHTAIAEWIACLLYIAPRSKRLSGGKRTCVLLLALCALLATHAMRVCWDGFVWLLWMYLAMGEMLGTIFLCCRSHFWKGLYDFAHAFVAAEFAASLEWQLYCYVIYSGQRESLFLQYLVMAIVYALVFGLLYLINQRPNLMKDRAHISWQEAASTTLIALAMVGLSNIAFTFRESVVALTLGAGVLFVRTLADFGGLVMLYAHDELRREMYLSMELRAMDTQLNQQYEQYRLMEANNEALHRIYHDLKHQIDFIRNEPDEERKASYLMEMEEAVSIREAAVETGSSVLDTLLTSKKLLCMEDGIVITCFADAKALEKMDMMDICSIFGNAIDNAIEYEKKVPDPDCRLIKVSVYPQKRFLLIRVENYCDETVPLKDGLPETTKKDKNYHGFGVKSIRRAVEKYDGTLSFTQEDGWFILSILLPLAREEGEKAKYGLN